MRFFALASARLLRLAAAATALTAFAIPAAQAQGSYDQYPQGQSAQTQDPPDQTGRISALQGTVSIQPSGAQDWGQAYPNLPIGPGDRIYTDRDGQAEIQVGQTYLRVGPNTDITLIGSTAESISWGVAQGSLHIRSFGLWQGQTLNLSTPNGDAQLGNPGELRLDVLPDQNTTIVGSLNSGPVVSGAGSFYQQMGNWQSLALAGSNPVYPQWLQPAAPDFLDQWSQQRDRQILSAASYRYVNPEVSGAADLDAYGDWTPDTDYGPMWFPRATPADWQPYHYGHWINRDPWGWVWVEDEPWGYAPFHYGRWVVYRGRWGWVPGPREVRPVWSPALVVFAGGIHAGGVGLSVWFPLGPGEPYRPWYRCSPRYIDRVNISNIHEGRAVHVQNTYVNVVNVTNVTYINRGVGASAMRPDDFAAGRSARQSSVQVDRRQFDHVQVVDHPAPVTRQSFVQQPAARPVPVATKAPAFINRQGMQITARPGAQPVAPPHVQTPQQPRPLPGRTVAAPPAESRFQNGNPQPRQPGNQFGSQPGNGNRPQQNGAAPAQNQPATPQTQQQPASGARPVGRPIAPINRPGQPLQQPAQEQDKNQNQPQRQNPQQPATPQQNARPGQSQPQQQQQPAQPQQNARPGQGQPAQQPQQPSAQPQQNARPNQNQPAQQQPKNQPQPNAAPVQPARPQDRPQPQAKPAPNNKQNHDQKDQKKEEKKDDKKDK